LLRQYKQQNGQQKLSRAITRADVSRIMNMPQAARSRGEMPDMSKGNWSQTPATSNVLAPRGFGYYDAFEHDPYTAATHMSIGPATPILGTTVCGSGLVTGAPRPLDGLPGSLETGGKLLIVMPSPGVVQARLFECSSQDGLDYSQSADYASTQLNSDQPDNCIPTRCSLRLRNWTQHVGTGGQVRILRMTTGVALSGTIGGQASATRNVELANFMEAIRTHARTRTYGGEELIETHQKNCTVVDQSKATWFTDFNSQMSVRDVPWATQQGWPATDAIDAFTLALHDPSYTPIALLFEPFEAAVSGGIVGNKYEVSVRSQFLAHYAQGTMLANMACDPEARPDDMIRHRNHEEGKGSVLERVGKALQQGASWAWNHREQIGGMVGRFAGIPGMQRQPRQPLMIAN
jgi:hypothetical protein